MIGVGANNMRRSLRGGGKGLCHRIGAPTILGGARDAAGRVGAV